MQWDVVVVAVRPGHRNKELENEFKLLRKFGILTTEEVLFVEDACNDAGSAGSLLNALLITAERLSARAGFSVLSEDIFYNSSILLFLVGPNGGAFHPLRCPEKWELVPETIITRHLENLKRLGAAEYKGLWICGTDSCFNLRSTPKLSLSQSAISVFTFPWETETLHGSYLLGEKGDLNGVEYPSLQKGPAPLVLTLLFFPPTVAATILSLHSLHPLSASTYYGEDTGTIGLKLSLFFDLLMATCLDRSDYLDSEVGEEKIHQYRALRMDARSIIFEKMNRTRTEIVSLEASDYFYFTGDDRLEETRLIWIDTLCQRLQRTVSDRSLKIDAFPSLVALDKIHGPEVRQKVFGALWEVIERGDSVASRALYALSDFLFLLSEKHGGLRMGPVANPAFKEIFDSLRKNIDLRVHLYEMFRVISEDWTTDVYKLVRGARHVEAAAQIIYGKRTVQLKPRVELDKFQGGKGVRVQSAARSDIFGGWLDTPPITYETRPSAVINMAISIDDQLPLSCELRLASSPGLTIVIDQRTDTITSSSEVLSLASRPSDHGALVCACFVSLGLLQSASLSEDLQTFYSSPGVVISCISALPHGSGLGTSSILACCIISALLGQIPEKETLVHLVLYVEHLLTTGGGWQDQVGGIYPGIKISEFKDRVVTRPISISREFEAEINRRLVLVYTGKTRLAKNLLQEVVRNWYSGGAVVDLMKTMQNELENCETLLKNGKFPSSHVELYYEVKKKLATGCEPPQVAFLVQTLKNGGICEAAWLAGAGGGGFLYCWLSLGKSLEDIRSKIAGTNMSTHCIKICDNPIILEEL